MNPPNIADELAGNWHKVAAMLLHRLAGDQQFSVAEIQSLPPNHTIVASHEQDGTVLRFRLLPNAEAERIAREFAQKHRPRGGR